MDELVLYLGTPMILIAFAYIAVMVVVLRLFLKPLVKPKFVSVVLLTLMAMCWPFLPLIILWKRLKT